MDLRNKLHPVVLGGDVRFKHRSTTSRLASTGLNGKDLALGVKHQFLNVEYAANRFLRFQLCLTLTH